ncbi:MAG: NAD(P)-dependent oxidoreductase [Patescibacteria group bacterium]|jgi:phosphoglycerate dehydrogenase-like enzyme
MPKIVVTHDLGLSPEDIKRLKLLGEVTFFNDRPESGDVWLSRCQGADIICSGIPGLRDKYQELKNVFISLPLVGVSYLNKEILNKNNIKVSNSPGCNKDAVSEWVIGMMINLLRDLPFFINNKKLPQGKMPPQTLGLVEKKVLILGRGNVGTRVGEICNSLKMKVDFFDKGDDLIKKIVDQDIIINCLSTNKSTINLLDKTFFTSLKKGSFFISITNHEIYDLEAMLGALDKGILLKAAIDDGTMNLGNTDDPFYKRLISHPQILATPHIAHNTEVSNKVGHQMMIDNVEAYLKGKPINLI